jgi:hypothetical protein
MSKETIIYAVQAGDGYDEHETLKVFRTEEGAFKYANSLGKKSETEPNIWWTDHRHKEVRYWNVISIEPMVYVDE